MSTTSYQTSSGLQKSLQDVTGSASPTSCLQNASSVLLSLPTGEQSYPLSNKKVGPDSKSSQISSPENFAVLQPEEQPTAPKTLRIAALRTLRRHSLSIEKWPHELLSLTLKKSDFCACQRWKKLSVKNDPQFTEISRREPFLPHTT
ncbi:hypothetical protein [Pseudomonas aeruginosa]|uniref:hypothetical protein n=1 Tax=Pseudomonas aeruginosa TaxID=287 RepID=UPI001F16157E|nr:hypothetical protein [Pseudomonas aeruginosa]